MVECYPGVKRLKTTFFELPKRSMRNVFPFIVIIKNSLDWTRECTNWLFKIEVTVVFAVPFS